MALTCDTLLSSQGTDAHRNLAFQPHLRTMSVIYLVILARSNPCARSAGGRRSRFHLPCIGRHLIPQCFQRFFSMFAMRLQGPRRHLSFVVGCERCYRNRHRPDNRSPRASMPGAVPTAAIESVNASGDSRAGVASVIGACRSTAIRLLDADASQRRHLNCLQRKDYSNA